MIHHHHTTSQAERGEALTISSITTGLIKARKMTSLTENDTLPTFYEQRSLAERLYREQGMDIQHYLVIKNQTQTDKYDDDRGKD